MTNQISNNGKTVAIVSYITWIGWIVAFVLNSSNKTSLGFFHLRQSGFIHILFAALSLISFVFRGVGLISVLVGIAYVLLLILAIIGLVSALNGEEKKVPFIGDMAQNILSGLQ